MADFESVDINAAIGLPAHVTSARRARELVKGVCSAAGLPDDLCHTAALLTSELVANAVLHGEPHITMQALLPSTHLRVEVRDSSDGIPVPGQPPVDSPSGRGMQLVELLATRWGVEPGPGGVGKVVWFELDFVEPEDL